MTSIVAPVDEVSVDGIIEQFDQGFKEAVDAAVRNNGGLTGHSDTVLRELFDRPLTGEGVSSSASFWKFVDEGAVESWESHEGLMYEGEVLPMLMAEVMEDMIELQQARDAVALWQGWVDEGFAIEQSVAKLSKEKADMPAKRKALISSLDRLILHALTSRAIVAMGGK